VQTALQLIIQSDADAANDRLNLLFQGAAQKLSKRQAIRPQHIKFLGCVVLKSVAV
jgi:hypothetical protein